MAGKKATRKTTRAASAKKAAAKASAAPGRKRRRKATAKKAAGKTTKRAAKRIAKKTAAKTARKPPKTAKKATRKTAPKAATEAPPAAMHEPDDTAGTPAGVRNPTGGERALLGRGPWWWKESLRKTTPEAPDAAAFRRDPASAHAIPPTPAMSAVTPINLAALMPADTPDDEAPGADAGADAIEASGPPAPPEDHQPDPVEALPQDPEPAPIEDVPFGPQPPDSSDTLRTLQALLAADERQAPAPAQEADPLEAPLSVEALDTLRRGESAALDEVMEALKVLEGNDAAPAVESAGQADAESPPAALEAGDPEDADPETAEAQDPPDDGLDAETDEPGSFEAASEPDRVEPPVDEPEPVPAGEPAPAAEAEPPAEEVDAPRTIKQLDDEVAGNVDKLLHGEFESVDELLEGEFDEPAPVAEPPEVADHDSTLQDPEDVVKSSSETGVESEIAVADMVDDSCDDPPGDPKGDGVPDRADFIDVDGSAPEPPPKRAPVAEEPEPERAGRPEPIAAAGPEPAAAACVVEPRAGSPRSTVIIALLEWANAPRRHLPPSARVIVDWVALSLLLWVPVVWVFALVVAG